ncbi:NTP/NDP exchange transporter [Pontibacter sp. CAU 1760]
MHRRLHLLLNIKPGEAKLVGHLFLVQYFIGVATAFLFTSSLTLILSSYPVSVFPRVYLLAAVFLLLANLLYSKLEARLSPEKLLQTVVLFSAASILVHWLCLTFLRSQWLPLLLAVWNMVVYMLVGYAFWGLTSMLFNVRESKRLFSVVGAGDIPAKMLGYFSVTALVPLIGVVNLLWVSVLAFVVVDVLLRKFDYNAEVKEALGPAAHAHPPGKAHPKPKQRSLLQRYFHNRLIFHIAIWSLLAHTIYAVIDFTFLAEIKNRYTSDNQLATFIAVFFAFGRLLAIGIKLLFSSRFIAHFGLATCLLIVPVLLFAVNAVILAMDGPVEMHLYAFGGMVLLSEILRSTLQEPVFFVLFQPLSPHSRLKGHLIAKGYTLPFALLLVGAFLHYYLQDHAHVPILQVSQLLLFLLLIWGASVFLVRKAYRGTLQNAMKKGYFAGSELFLNNLSVKNVLVQKATSHDPKVAIHALHLLERSGYPEIAALLLMHLKQGFRELRAYAASRILENKWESALPFVKERLELESVEEVRLLLIKALYLLDDNLVVNDPNALTHLDQADKKAALTGLLSRHEPAADTMVTHELQRLTSSPQESDRLVAIEMIAETQRNDHAQVLKTLLQDGSAAVYTSAMEAVGKVREVRLLKQLVALGMDKKAHATLQKALLHFGDMLFHTPYVQAGAFTPALLPILVKVAGKTRGAGATAFLERLLVEAYPNQEAVIEARWHQHTPVGAEAQLALQKYLKLKLKQSQRKASYYLHLLTYDSLKPLQDALCSEIRQDIQHIFKAMALVMKRKEIERVMELYNQADSAKVYNAIEMLELIVPKHYFQPLNMLLELEQDIYNNQVVRQHHVVPPAETTIGAILQDTQTGFSTWTKAVACYMIPRVEGAQLPLAALSPEHAFADPLFQETREYVLSTLIK